MQIAVRTLALLASAALISALSSGSVLAHALYERSDPAAGANVESAPAQVQAWFMLELNADESWIQVYDQSGNRVDQDDSKVDLDDPSRKQIVISLKSGLPNGVYTVKWHTRSTEPGHEEHVFEGIFRFGVGVPVPADRAQDAPVDLTEAHTHAEDEAAHAEGEQAHAEGEAAPANLPATGTAALTDWTVPALAGLALIGGGLVLRRRSRAAHRS